MEIDKPRVVAWDIESTHLKASFGHIICVSFLDMFSRGKPVTFRIDDPKYKGKRVSDDSKLVAAVKDYLEGSWMWVSWYGKQFDYKFLNGRLALHGMRPVEKRLHLDLLYFGRMLRMHSARLDAIAKTFEFKTQKTDILPAQWLAAGEGDGDAINYVVKHCEADVRVLRDAFKILAPLVSNIHKGT